MLEERGDSVLVVGDEATIKVHVHTDEPEAAVALFDRAGEVSQLDVADMREQIAERTARLQAGRCAAVAVVAGPGMRELYEGLGAFVVDGGETFNPSIYDLLAAIHEVPAEEVLVFPNNANVVMAAERAAELSDKEARVVPCTSQQAGVAALVELDPTASIDDNAERMDEALAGIRAGSVAPAARDDAKGRFVKGDAVGFVGDEIVAWGGAGSTLTETMAAPRRGRGDPHRGQRGGRADRARRARGRMRRRAWSSSCTRGASRTTGGCWRRSDVSDGLPVLWQYSFSNYNEKARWALDFKGIRHRRRSLMPGGSGAMAFSRGSDAARRWISTVGGSSIRRRSSPRWRRASPIRRSIPADPEERRRALALEEYFDEHAGHDMRRVGFWEPARTWTTASTS